MKGRLLGVAGAAALLAAVVLQAWEAGAATLRDPNDTVGVLDVRQAVKLYRGRPPLWKVRTYEPWQVRGLAERGFVVLYLDTVLGQRFDYYVLVSARAPRLRGLLFRDRLRPAPDRRLGFVSVWRRDRRSLSLRLALRRLTVGPQRESYRWQVRTLLTSRRCKRVCFDRAPDRGAVEEPLARPTPSPSPSTH